MWLYYAVILLLLSLVFAKVKSMYCKYANATAGKLTAGLRT